MRFSFVLWFSLYFISLSGQGFREDMQVTLQFRDTPLIEVLEYLKKTYDIRFAYDVSSLQEITISIHVHNQPLRNVLKELLGSRGMRFHFQATGVLISPANEQGPSVRNLKWNGQLLDSLSGEALPFATIFIPSLSRGTTTNADGHFLLEEVPDTALVVISYVGYQPKYLPIRKAVKQNAFYLRSKEALLPELIVTTELEPMRIREDPGHITFNPQLLTGLPTMGEVDVMRSLQLLPGISATNETSSGLVVRGSTPDQNLILFDGFSVFQLDHFFGVFSAFNHQAIKDVQLYKSGFDARYGGRTSSVLDITGKSGDTQGLRVGVSASLISVNAALETPIGEKWSLLVAARRAFTDIIQSKLYKNLVENVRNDDANSVQKRLVFDNQDLEPTFYFYDYNLKLSFRPSARDVLSLSLYQGRDNLVLRAAKEIESVQVSIEDLAEWGNVGTSLRWARQWNPRWYSQVRMSWSDYDHDTSYRTSLVYNDGLQTLSQHATSDLFNDVGSANIGFDTEWQLSPKYTMHFGTSIEGLSTTLTSQVGDTLSKQELQQEGGLLTNYWQHDWQVSPKLLLKAGIRHQYFDLIDSSLWEPRLGFQYKVLPKLTVKGAWGRYHQVINRIINSDINNGLPDFWLLADVASPILIKKSIHWVGGMLFQHGGWTLDVEAYHKSLDGLVDFIPLGRYFSTEVLPPEQFVTGSSTAKGMDFLVQRETKRYSAWMAYSLSKVDDLFQGLNGNLSFPSNEDQRHEFKTVHLWKTGNWRFSGTWIYATGKPYTAPQGFYEVRGVGTDPVNIFEITAINSFRLPNYHRLDLSATYQWQWGSWKVESGISVYNLYNRNNIKFKRFDITNIDPSGEQLLDAPRVFSFDVNMLGITPNLFVNFKL